ncbi:sigma-54 dependent transcriptional regulator [Microbulbifer bruguierae]|uniref:Sigma-54 dependent transcriptional regulator n=1 Tax=Microbulbifer bruguierae TaxID=3029061 RepID=A0ABY8NIC2_9GAMM|nr:sigma-54 dependent transcriptional regulator [Microbulbifer bruguierae]WGL18184.1 sigma-54 dependent transcriptional regulator [Microbulbifer bruguierae]
MADRSPIALVVDDEPDICDLISMTLQRMDVRADVAMSVAEASRRLSEKQYDFCLTDMRLPDGDGLQLVEKIQDLPPGQTLPVAVITAHGNMDSAISALKLGAFDFVSKPVNLERLRALVQLALRLSEDHHLAQQEFPPMLQGQSAAIQALRQQIEKVARSDAPVHIYGEIGSGKELTARSIHQQGPRAQEAFISLQCSAIPTEQLEATLFGCASGGNYKPGLLQQANRGSLFIDEVTELPLEIQARLLRTIQEKRFTPTGTDQTIELDVRILSASLGQIASNVRSGYFRSDLYYRISVIEVAVPPLRQRSDDIPLLTRNLLRWLSANTQGSARFTPPRVTLDAVDALQAYSFPGNLRELENILERALTLSDSNTLRAENLLLHTEAPLPPTSPCGHSVYLAAADIEVNAGNTNSGTSRYPVYPQQFSTSEYETLDDFLQSIEREALEKALNETQWNRTAAAEKLGISFRSLRYRLKKLGLEND